MDGQFMKPRYVKLPANYINSWHSRMMQKLNAGSGRFADKGGATSLAITLVVAAVFAAATFPFIYRDVLGEADLSAMVFAMLHGHATGFLQNEGYHYGYTFSFGYYYAFYHLVPGVVLTSAKSLIAAINTTGFCSAVAGIALLGLYLGRLYGARVALIATSVFAFSPVFLELGTSGHPVLPAFCMLMMGACLLTGVTDDQISPVRSAILAVLACAALVIALCIRSDVVLGMAFIVTANPASVGGSLGKQVWRMWPRVLTCVAAFFCFLLVQRIAVGPTEAAGGQALLNYLLSSNTLGAITKGVGVLVMGTGLAAIAACLAGFVWGGYRYISVLEILAAGSLVILSLLMWLPNPTPARHFLFLTLAVAVACGILFGRRSSLPIALAVAAGIPIATQLADELSYRFVVAHYDWTFPSLTERRATMAVPMGLFTRNHRANQARAGYFRKEGQLLRDICNSRGKLLVVADEPYYYLMALAENDPQMHLSERKVSGATALGAKSASCETAVVTKYVAWPRDVVPDLLADATYEGWPVYYQELTRGRYDKTGLPADRAVQLTVVQEN
jgi:hypothetical protein